MKKINGIYNNQNLVPLWHLLHSYNNLELKMSGISYKIDKKREKNILLQDGIRTRDRTGSTVNH